MYGLNETAKLYHYTGQSGGKPVFSEHPVTFRCRTQPETFSNLSRNASGSIKSGVEYINSVRIFAQGITADDGDKIITANGKTYRVMAVQEMRGRARIHHLEILAEAAQ